VIDISILKNEFAKNFPNHELTIFLINMPNLVSETTFLEFVKVGLKILNKR